MANYEDALADDPQNPHLYIQGKTQSGKSTLAFHRILADINRGRGVTVIDAKSELVLQLKQWIPRAHAHRVIYLDMKSQIPIDFMSVEGQDEWERHIEKDEVVAEIKFLLLKTANTVSMPIIKANADWIVSAFLDYNDNPKTPSEKRATFLDLNYFLTNKVRQREIISRLRQQKLRDYWADPNNIPTGENLRHLTTRLSDFMTSDILHRMFDCPNPKLNISQAIRQQRIILVDIGRLTEPQKIYAGLIVAKIRQHFYRFIGKPIPMHHHLYADEFHLYQTSDFPDMLSRAGGLGLHLTLITQYPSQIDSATWAATFKNTNNYYLFNSDPEDTARFKPYFPQPHVPRDRSYELEQLQAELHDAETLAGLANESYLQKEKGQTMAEKREREAYNDRKLDEYMRYNGRAYDLEEKISHLESEIAKDQSLSTADYQKELLHMPKGQCLYLSIPHRICRTIPTPPPYDKHNPASCAEIIDRVTDHQYKAEPMDRACYTNSNASSSSKTKDLDGGPPDEPTTQPPNPHKEKRPKPPR